MQISLFDGNKRFKFDKPIRLIELFAGIGSQAKALKNLNLDFEHYRICEFDKYAVQSYNAVHGTNFKTSDITKIKAEDLGITDTDKFCYIMTYSFPCQDLSNAGKQAGMAKGSGTRSGLLWEVERLLDECKELPQVLLMENVPAVIGQANIEHFAKWQEKLESLGYKNKWQILNAKDFGIPQNRERCFMVSILGDYYYEFPNKIPLKLRLKDMLEERVDEKYYLSDSTIERIAKWNAQQDPLKDIEKEKVISPCLTARGAGEEHSGMVLISEPKCEEYTINTTVKVRKHEVNIEKLKALLKEQKKWLGWTINVIAEYLKRPKTEVEHWFRSDSSFTIPSADIWYELKDLLDIETDEFDKSITEFIEKPNEFESSNRGYGCNELSPTILATTSPNLVEPKKIGQTDNHAKGGIYDTNGIARTIMATDYKQPLQILEPTAVDEQNEYIRQDGCIGTLTTDGSSPKHNNRIIEPKVWDGFNQQVRVDSSVVGTLTQNCGSDTQRNGQGIIEGLRIRKLTPKECWRLMGFSDSDVDKAIAIGMSNAQLYKQAGNSICVNVLMAIFEKMI